MKLNFNINKRYRRFKRRSVITINWYYLITNSK